MSNTKEVVMLDEEKNTTVHLPQNFMRYLKYTTLTSQQFNHLNARKQYHTFYKYTKSEIISYLQAPDRNELQLREASIYLYNACSYYHRVIDHFAKMLTYAYALVPSKFDQSKVNPEKLKSEYQKKSVILENMAIRDSFRAPITVAMREDVSYNYVLESKDSFMFRALDPRYCQLSSKTDNVYDLAFDFQYFDTNQTMLELYPPEFTEKYNIYKAQGTGMRWQKLEPRNTMVLKANFDIDYPIPPFAGAFEAIFDIIDYKSLQLAKTETGNYKVLVMKIPINEKGDFEIDFDIAQNFYNQMGANLPDNIGLAMSPMDIDSFEFEKSGTNTDADLVRSAEQNFFSSAGVSNQLFNNEKATASALKQSIICDQAIIWGLLSQIERWINRYLKFQTGSQKFHVVMPQITVYNEADKADQYLKAAQNGLPTKMLYGATLGLDPLEMLSMNYVENDLFELPDKLIPLQTSYTMSGDAGRPTNESQGKEVTEKGEETSDRGEE